jgi:hypothetical protein
MRTAGCKSRRRLSGFARAVELAYGRVQDFGRSHITLKGVSAFVAVASNWFIGGYKIF